MQECFQLTTFVIERDAYALEAMPLHFTAAVELKKKNELFLRAHRSDFNNPPGRFLVPDPKRILLRGPVGLSFWSWLAYRIGAVRLHLACKAYLEIQSKVETIT